MGPRGGKRGRLCESERLGYEEKKVRDWTMRRKKGEI
jgi:hypothetical protein